MKNVCKHHTLLTYLSVRLFSIVIGTAILLSAVLETLTLLDQMSPILERGLGIMGIVHYMILRFPLLFTTILPLSTLIGCVIMLTQLTIYNEITTLRAAGLSSFQLITKLLPITLLLSGIYLILSDQIIPHTELNLAIWWNKTQKIADKNKSIFFYDRLNIVEINNVMYGGNKITGLTIIKRRDLSRIDYILKASEANYINKQWILTNAQILKVISSTDAHFAPLLPSKEPIFNNSIQPRDIIAVSAKSMPQSINNILKQLHNERPSMTPTSRLKTTLWERLCMPFIFVIMLLIAIPVTHIPPRAGLRSWLPIYCLGCGLLFIIFQAILAAFGNAGTLPAPFATISAVIIFFLTACTIILMIEEKK